jgi:predicted patatin/cPLA2 family phospholipase
MRGVFTAGVLDAMAEGDRKEPPFDLVIGVSSGAYCGASYLAGQHGRILRIIRAHMTSSNYANPWQVLLGRSLVDQDYLMEVTRRHDPLDVAALRASPSRFEAVATAARSGAPAYLPAQGQDCLSALHATMAIPVFYRGGPIRFRQGDYFDGSVSDPLPVGRAIALGATEVTVVCTSRPGTGARQPPFARLGLGLVLGRYPTVVEAILRRHLAREAASRLMAAPPPGVTVRTIAPPADFSVRKFTRDPSVVLEGYHVGRRTFEA